MNFGLRSNLCAHIFPAANNVRSGGERAIDSRVNCSALWHNRHIEVLFARDNIRALHVAGLLVIDIEDTS